MNKKVISAVKKVLAEELNMDSNKKNNTRRLTRSEQRRLEQEDQFENADAESQLQEPMVPVAAPRQQLANVEDSETDQNRQESDDEKDDREHSGGRTSDQTENTIINTSLAVTDNTISLDERMAMLSEGTSMSFNNINTEELRQLLLAQEASLMERNASAVVSTRAEETAGNIPSITVESRSEKTTTSKSTGAVPKSPITGATNTIPQVTNQNPGSTQPKEPKGEKSKSEGNQELTVDREITGRSDNLTGQYSYEADNEKLVETRRNTETGANNQLFSVHINASNQSVDIPDGLTKTNVEVLLKNLQATYEKMAAEGNKTTANETTTEKDTSQSRLRYSSDAKRRDITGSSNPDDEPRKSIKKPKTKPKSHLEDSMSNPFTSQTFPTGATASSPRIKPRIQGNDTKYQRVKSERTQPHVNKKNDFKSDFKVPRTLPQGKSTGGFYKKSYHGDLEDWIEDVNSWSIPEKSIYSADQRSQRSQRQPTRSNNNQHQQTYEANIDDSGYINDEEADNFRTSSRTGQRTTRGNNGGNRGGGGSGGSSSSSSDELSDSGDGRDPSRNSGDQRDRRGRRDGDDGHNDPNNPNNPGGNFPGGSDLNGSGEPDHTGESKKTQGVSIGELDGSEWNYIPLYMDSPHFPNGLGSDDLQGQEYSSIGQLLPEMPRVLIQALVGIPPDYLLFDAKKDPIAEMLRKKGMWRELVTNYDKRNRFIKEGKANLSFDQSKEVFEDFMIKCLEMARRNRLWDSDLKEVLYSALIDSTKQQLQLMKLDPEGRFGEFLTATRYAYVIMLHVLPREQRTTLQGAFAQIRQMANQNLTSYLTMCEKSYRMAFVNYGMYDEPRFYKTLISGLLNKKLKEKMIEYQANVPEELKGAIGWEQFQRAINRHANALSYAVQCKHMSQDDYKGAQTQAIDNFKQQLQKVKDDQQKEVGELHEVSFPTTDGTETGTVNSLLGRGQNSAPNSGQKPFNCYNCGSPGHYANICPNPPNRNGNGIQNTTTQNQYQNQNQSKVNYYPNKPTDSIKKPFNQPQPVQPSNRVVAAFSTKPSQTKAFKNRRNPKELNERKRRKVRYRVVNKGVNAIDPTGEGYLILDEGEILETESESEEEEDSVAQEEGNEENEDDSTGIYSVNTVSQKNSDIGFGF